MRMLMKVGMVVRLVGAVAGGVRFGGFCWFGGCSSTVGRAIVGRRVGLEQDGSGGMGLESALLTLACICWIAMAVSAMH